MIRRVYSYPLPVDAATSTPGNVAPWDTELDVHLLELELPAPCRVLDVQVVRNRPKLYALVDPQAPTELRKVVAVGTGHAAPPTEHDDPERAWTYLGTARLDGGQLVLHFFGQGLGRLWC